MALSRLNRLSGKDIPALAKTGRLLSREGLSVRYLKRGGNGRSRFGVAVSNKALPKASERNALRRVITGFISGNPDILAAGMDFLIIVKDPGKRDGRKDRVRKILSGVFSELRKIS